MRTLPVSGMAGAAADATEIRLDLGFDVRQNEATPNMCSFQ